MLQMAVVEQPITGCCMLLLPQGEPPPNADLRGAHQADSFLQVYNALGAVASTSCG